MNKAMLVGTVNKDAELKYLPSGTAQAKFTLTTQQEFTNKAGEHKTTKHIQPILMWGKLAEEMGEQVRAGCIVAVVGKLQTSQWVDAKNERHSMTEVIADNFDGVKVLVHPANQKAASQVASAPASRATSGADNAAKDADDEVPF